MAYPKLIHDSCQAFKQHSTLPVTSYKAFCIAINHGWKDRVLYTFPNTSEVTGNTYEFLHLSEVLGLDLFKWWLELQLLLSEEHRKTF